jgi:hypothetical protein
MIPFVRDLKFEYGVFEQVTPLIRRVVANNPGPFTFLGTGTYIIGHGNVAVVDPGPDQQEHIDAVLRALRDRGTPATALFHDVQTAAGQAALVREASAFFEAVNSGAVQEMKP